MAITDMDQISADQILQDAYDHKQPDVKHSNYRINDVEELKEYQLKIRTSYEKALQFKRTDIPQYIRYARWEWDLHNYSRGRSIFERALSVDHANVKLWHHYIDCELTAGNINHARNLLERAVTLLPKVDKFYLDYIQLEERLSEYGNVHAIFKRWLRWKPREEVCWKFINFLIRYKDYDSARGVYGQLIKLAPTTSNYIAFIDFEIKHAVSSQSVRDLCESLMERDIAVAEKYADYELSQHHDVTRARDIYKFALTRDRDGMLEKYAEFEKRYGDSDTIETVVLHRRLHSLQPLQSSIDSWWEWLDIKQKLGELHTDDFESAVDMVKHKAIWLRYAYHVELIDRDIEKAAEVYRRAVKAVPCVELYRAYALCELRRGQLSKARKIFGLMVGKYGEVKEYVELETKLMQYDRVRKIYEAALARSQDGDIETWLAYIEFEQSLGETARVEALFELVIQLGYKEVESRYLQFLRDSLSFDKTRAWLLAKQEKGGVQGWVAYAMNELMIPTPAQLQELEKGDGELEFEVTTEQIDRACALFEEGLQTRFQNGDEQVELYAAYKRFISVYAVDKLDKLESKAKLVKAVDSNSGEEKLQVIWGQKQSTSNKFWENAQRWAASG